MKVEIAKAPNFWPYVSVYEYPGTGDLQCGQIASRSVSMSAKGLESFHVVIPAEELETVYIGAPIVATKAAESKGK